MADQLLGSPNEIDPILRELEASDLYDLRVCWRKIIKTAAGEHLPRAIMLRILAYRIQARALGDLSAEARSFLSEIEAARSTSRRGKSAKGRSASAVPIIPPVPRRSQLKPGTLIVRSHGGRNQVVTVTGDGFLYEGKPFTTLSEIAFAITGTRWSGPRFFGLQGASAALKRKGGS